MMSVCEVHCLGLVDYLQAWDLQNRLAQEIAERKRPPCLLLLEHPHTYTFGRGGRHENLLWDEQELERRGVKVYWVDRGGDVTYHGPGQLVGYPLLPLAPLSSCLPAAPAGDGGGQHIPQVDYVGYLRKLELIIIKALAQFGVQGKQVAGKTGVWVQVDDSRQEVRGARIAQTSEVIPASPWQVELGEAEQPGAKIAAIGVKVDAKGITRHGFALNVNPDMTYWEGIIGCGLAGLKVTSLASMVQPAPCMAQVIEAIVAAFAQMFALQCQVFSTQTG